MAREPVVLGLEHPRREPCSDGCSRDRPAEYQWYGGYCGRQRFCQDVRTLAWIVLLWAAITPALSTLLALEALTVIGLGLSQIVMGRGSLAENQLMVTEKVLAWAEAATTVATGGSSHQVVRSYRV